MATTFTQDPSRGPTFAPDPNAPEINNGTIPLSGFASQYQPNQLENVWQTPWAILPDVFPGINPAGGGYQGLRDIGADPLALYNIMAGRSQDLSGAGVGGFANFLANMYASLGSVGGRQFSGRELLGSLFDPVGSESADTRSALYNILTAGDAATQMRTLFGLARDASNVGLNPLAARGYQAGLARAGDKATNMMMHRGSADGANNKTMFELIRQIAPGLVPN